ncbi:MAG: sensor histidine kinase [Betaproteobacteria bacterium]|nr:sensor histidine kinase [Betaproteobacteria bacterium]
MQRHPPTPPIAAKPAFRLMRINPFLPLGEFFKQLGLLWLSMVVLAVGLTQIKDYPFWKNLVYSLSISTSIFLLSRLLGGLRGSTRMDWKIAVIAIPAGTAVGVYLAAIATGTDLLRLFAEHPNHLVLTLVISLIFGTGFCYYFYSREAIAEATAAMREDALARAAYEKQLAEANLRLLQAQIEPHFLFNTLSNILSLIRNEPQKAEHMLEDLTDYLRVSLQRTRTDQVTLGDEIMLLRAYLGIQQVRMGARLSYSIDVPAELNKLRLPPLIIQPLAENAVHHGLEPQAQGGRITVKACRSGDKLDIEIADTGSGLSEDSVPGVGLSNVRARLQALYADRAQFLLQPNQPRGLKIRLEIPIDPPAQPAA